MEYGHQYYKVAVATVFFYDMLLTLPDEVSHVINVILRQTDLPKVKYVWHGNKSLPGALAESITLWHSLML